MQDVEHKYGPDIHNDFVIDFIRRNQRNPFLALDVSSRAFDTSPGGVHIAGHKRGAVLSTWSFTVSVLETEHPKNAHGFGDTVRDDHVEDQQNHRRRGVEKVLSGNC